MRIFLTGDTHRQFDRIQQFCEQQQTTIDDILFIMGDVGINYYGNNLGDLKIKKKLAKLPITIVGVKGNHEEYAGNIDTYIKQPFFSGAVYVEPDFPNLLFARDGEIYTIHNRKILVVGGAYSVDKHFRLVTGKKWFKGEQPDMATKAYTEQNLMQHNWKVDYVMTHTCPEKYIPVERFLSMVDQNTVDRTTEKWLDFIEDRLNYKVWYCGHYHTDKWDNKIRFLFNDIIML